jgi:hypothetical protein
MKRQGLREMDFSFSTAEHLQQRKNDRLLFLLTRIDMYSRIRV